MDWTRQCAAVIPCFNEDAFIGGVIMRVRRHLPAVVVVDDGSKDATAEKAAAAGAEVVRHPLNRGKGAALRTGWQRTRDRGFAWALTLDGDSQHAPEDIPAFLACAEATAAALVVGNRMARADMMPRIRRWTNGWMTRRLSKLVGVPLADSQCGFRLVSLGVLSRVPLAAEHFEIESELLIAFVAAGYRVEFVPIQVIYKASPSKVHPLVDGWRWLRWWLARRRRWPSQPHESL